MLEAIARDALRDPGAASRALERALEFADPGGLLLPFLLYPTAELLERQARLRTTHASLIAEILNLLSGHAPAARPPRTPRRSRRPLSRGELRVLRYLPTNLPAPEIAAELFVSLNTIRDPLAQRVRQARRAQPRRRGDASTQARPALALLAQALTRVAVSRTSRGLRPSTRTT